jgi:hypothetical protein
MWLLILSSSLCVALQLDQVIPMRNAILSGFALSPSYGRRCNACEEGHTLGGMVRLVFHDVVGGPDGEGANG